ncbi:hypothetical protein [uncultured Sneathiella sp.]|jgi:hypothetical protein|uniref:hypothetical protein n=1 Tax=uncultured Sneathiella sp. TaxID=879315 RepID=UPI0030EEDB97|tara:strand:- start:2316 stop:2780 length:465 start_codon:yes stop_codon:yes gene_type:complete
MTAINPDKLNRTHNLLTGWHDKMDQACAADGVITVNATDVDELKQALSDIDETHHMLNIQWQMEQATIDIDEHIRLVKQAGAMAIALLAEQGRKYGLRVMTQNSLTRTSDAAFELMRYVLADVDTDTQKAFADRLATNCRSIDEIDSMRDRYSK